MAKYKYYLHAGHYGGEHTIGTIPKEVAEYWLDKGADAFEEYMLDWDHDEINDSGTIPEEFQLPNWYDVDDIEHVCSIEFTSLNTLTVTDITNQKDGDNIWVGKEIAEIKMSEDKIGELLDEESDKISNNDDYIVYGQSFEKGSCSFEILETDEPFNASKLKFDVAVWNDLQFVTGINYDGESLSNEGMEGHGKSMACWIED